MIVSLYIFTKKNIYICIKQSVYLHESNMENQFLGNRCYNCVNLHALGSSSPRRCDFENAFSSKTMQCRQCLCLNNMLFPAHRFSHSVFPKKFVSPINSSPSLRVEASGPALVCLVDASTVPWWSPGWRSRSNKIRDTWRILSSV